MLNRLVHPVRASRLAHELGLRWEGEDIAIETVAPLSAPVPNALTFARKSLSSALPSGVCVLAAERPETSAWIVSGKPRLDFVRALLALERVGGFARADKPADIHSEAVVSPFAAIGKNVVIGRGTRIEPHVTIADNVRIGRDCWLKSGCVIGEAGFGLERDETGTPLRMLHFGGVVIGDRVEVGSLTTVCQGTLDPTVLEDDAKIDDHVHIAHNCRIGKKSLVIACAEVSGGVVVGEEAWIGPNASVLEKVKIGDRAFVGLGAVVIRDVLPNTTVVGNPARVITRKTT